MIIASGGDGEMFAHRVSDTAEWATAQRPGIAITMTRDDSAVWRDLLGALHALRADLEDRVSRAPVPAAVNLDRRRRVAARHTGAASARQRTNPNGHSSASSNWPSPS